MTGDQVEGKVVSAVVRAEGRLPGRAAWGIGYEVLATLSQGL